MLNVKCTKALHTEMPISNPRQNY